MDETAQVELLGQILVIEPDPVAARIIMRECSRLRHARLLRSVAEARALLETGTKLMALITEQKLCDGTGTSLIAACRSSHPLMPVLLLTAQTAPHVINRAHLLGAEFVAKPARRDNVRRFLRHAVAFERVSDQRVALAVETLVRRCSLSPRETDILAAAAQGTPRRVVADQIGTTENTIKSCIKSLLRKCEATALEEVVRSVWKQALAGSEAPSDGEPSRASVPPEGAFSIPPPTFDRGTGTHTLS